MSLVLSVSRRWGFPLAFPPCFGAFDEFNSGIFFSWVFCVENAILGCRHIHESLLFFFTGECITLREGEGVDLLVALCSRAGPLGDFVSPPFGARDRPGDRGLMGNFKEIKKSNKIRHVFSFQGRLLVGSIEEATYRPQRPKPPPTETENPKEVTKGGKTRLPILVKRGEFRGTFSFENI